ncbi:MAG TPA: hypothetical protein VL946_04715, partial [Lacibacter sp.]|nr:hypothetical protein [Lacibacter sp.]
MRYIILFTLISFGTLQAQVKVDLTKFSRKSGTTASVSGDVVSLSWPAGTGKTGKIILDLSATQPIFKSIELLEGKKNHQIVTGLDPAFVLTVGKRDLVSQNGWNIFFDKVPNKPFKAHNIEFVKQSASVRSEGTRTVITIGSMRCPD